MFRLFPRRRDNVRPARTKRSQPAVEGLEGRWLLSATNGGHWTYPVRVTYSFVPDGTSIGGTPSNLFSTMNAYWSTATWETAIAKAAATWEGAAPVNLVQVGDDGSAIGSGNYQQGAPNFGDIRFGAMPEADGTLAIAFLPPPVNGSSSSADIFFNSNANWSAYGYDLTTVALHEIGHALGLDHSSLSSAVMYASYTGAKQTLTTDDIGGIQSVYGARSSTPNTAPSTATPIALDGNGDATVTGVQITAATNQNWYTVVIPANTNGTLTVTMQSTNLSSLEPRLTFYNSSLRGLAQAQATTYGGTVTLTLSGVTPGQLYYIRAIANTNLAGSAGAYGLTVQTGNTPPPAIPIPYTTVAVGGGQGGTTSETSDSFTPAGHGHHRHAAIHHSLAGMGHALVVRVRHLRHLAGHR